VIGSIVEFSQEFREAIDIAYWEKGCVSLDAPDFVINGRVGAEKDKIPCGYGTVIGHYDWVRDQYRHERYIVDFPEWPWPIVCHVDKLEVVIPNCYKNKDLAYKV